MNLLWWRFEDFNQISSKIYNTKKKQDVSEYYAYVTFHNKEYIPKWKLHPENLRKITLCPNIFQEYELRSGKNL